jgi:hypothetical protein
MYGPGFGIVSGSPHLVWCQIDTTDQLYIGQLVHCSNKQIDGVAPMGKAAGAADTTNKRVPYGIVVATNNASPVFDSTYNVETITDVAASSNDREHNIPVGEPHGMFGKNDMVQVALIDPTTVIRGPIRRRAAGGGSAIRERTVATATSTTQVVITKGGIAGDSDSVRTQQTVYFRSGANAGEYRITDSSSSTVVHWDKALANSPTTSDTLVLAPGRPNGTSYVQVDSESMFINSNGDASTNYYVINVIRMDLSEAGNEYVDFQFGGDHFAKART